MTPDRDMVAVLHSTTDGSVWAAEFARVAKDLGYSDMDEGWLIGWFANAIECGRTHGQKDIDRLHSELAERDAALAVLGDAMVDIDPYLDQLICYASTTSEHKPNALVLKFRAAIRDFPASARAVMEVLTAAKDIESDTSLQAVAGWYQSLQRVRVALAKLNGKEN